MGKVWESILCVHPTNPSAIRMILRRVDFPGSSQKALCSPVLIELSQSAVQHVEANASHDLSCPLTVEQLKARNLYIPWLKDSPPVNQEVSQLKRPKLSCPKLTQLSQSAVQHVEAGAKASQVSSYLSWKRLKDSFNAEQKKVSQPKRPELVPRIRASKDPSPLRQKQQRQRKRPADELDKVSGSRGCMRAAKKDISGDLAQLKPGQSTGDTWNNTRAEEPCRLEVMKNLTGLWGSTGQGQPQLTSRANRLSPCLAQYLASTVTPRTFDLQIMGMTSDLMDFLDMPEERLSIELWDLGEGTGDQRYKANWQFSGEHSNVLMEGIWLQNDDNW